MAALCDVFVMDAFGTAHRAQASTNGVARHAPIACAGPLLVAELEALGKALESPKRPLTAIIGGSKVSTKIEVLQSLSTKVDELILGGGIANTILAASGAQVGKSLHEKDMLEFAAKLLRGEFGKAKIPLPTDVVVATSLDAGVKGRIKKVARRRERRDDSRHRPRDRGVVCGAFGGAGTIVWNGPLGVFENPEFAAGTRRVADAIAASRAFSIAGGGDTLAAIEQFGVGDRISYISTGGGAFLEFLEGKTAAGRRDVGAASGRRLTVPDARRALAADAGVREGVAGRGACGLLAARAGRVAAPACARARHRQGRRVDGRRLLRALGRAGARHGRHALRPRPAPGRAVRRHRSRRSRASFAR